MKYQSLIKTRYCETAQDGIFHHSSYTIYLEIARIEFLKSIGWDINALEKKNIFCPVIDLSIKYLKPLFSLEDIAVLIQIVSDSKIRLRFIYEILRGSDCIATGFSVHCFLNEFFKVIPIPQELFLQINKQNLLKKPLF